MRFWAKLAPSCATSFSLIFSAVAILWVYTGVTPTNLQYTGTNGRHANYSCDVSNPTGFQRILNKNPPFLLPFGVHHGYRYGVIQSTQVENTLTGGFCGHTDIFSEQSIFAALHLVVDIGIGHIPGVNLDFRCKARS